VIAALQKEFAQSPLPIAANAERIVWGTDWPHPGHGKPPAEISDPG
jgi:predicted TIM-barrel fold metal-dependent hydrolase